MPITCGLKRLDQDPCGTPAWLSPGRKCLRTNEMFPDCEKFPKTSASAAGPDPSGCGYNRVWRLPRAVRQVPSASDTTTALTKPYRSKAVAPARGTENDFIAVF